LNELLQDQKGGKRRSGAAGYGGRVDSDEIARLEAEMEDLRLKNEEDSVALSEFRESLATANLRAKGLETEKAALEKRIKTLETRAQDLEKELVDSAGKSRQVELQSREFNKQKTANVKEAQRLFDENETLKERVIMSRILTT